MLNLTFHGLGEPKRELPDGEDAYWVEPGFFAAVLDHVKGRENIQITFDDANESDYTIALPLLRARNLKARFFVVADRIDQKGFLSSKQIQTMCAEGMRIENHGMRHARWRGLPKTELYEELVESRDIIQRVVQQPITEAACPFGSYDRNAFRMLRERGYSRVYTSDGGLASGEAWIQPRNTIMRHHKLEHVEQLMTMTGGVKKLWRDFKMTVKRWR